MAAGPEQDRLEWLMGQVRVGRTTEAEREELELYLLDRPELRDEVAAHARAAELGGGWLERVEADDRLARREQTRWVRAERGVGLGLVVAGVALGGLLPVAAPAAAAVGGGLLLWSFVRHAWRGRKDDPYRKIEK
jgi:hypothetical protein